MIKKTSRILTLAAATLTLLAACVEDDNLQQEQVPIRLTSDIAATRAIASPTQDTQLESGEKVYVWANIEATSGTADWTQNAYIQAWEMTADGSGNLSSSNAYYYPPTSLSMVAIHGNFSTSFVEGLSPLPDFVTHTVKTDQSTLANYVVSDLLYWKQNGVTGNNNPITIAFNHKLSKIEIHLVAGDYTEDELDQMTVTLCNVLPTVSMDVTDGTVGQAYGSAVSITPLKKGKVDYEAIIPPQQKPLDFIEVRYNGAVVKVDAQVNGFDSDQRYEYDFSLNNKDIRKNPLWYVAEYNVNYSDGTYSWATTTDEGYLFSWSDALAAADKFDGWHLPSKYEYNSIFPGTDTSTTPTTYAMSDAAQVNIFEEIATSDGSAAVYNRTAQLSFGYNETSNNMMEKSYWYRVNSSLVYAIRYCDSEFCSAWKYEWTPNGMSSAYPTTVTITSVMIGSSLSTTDAQSLFGTNESKWEGLFSDLQFVNGNDNAHGAARRVFSSKGYNGSGSSANPNESTTPGNNGQYWSSTSHNSTDAFLFAFWRNQSTSFLLACHEFGTKTYARPIRLFKDSQRDIKLNPLWYVAEYNLHSDGTSFNTTASTSQGYLYQWSPAMALGYTYNTTGYNGYALPSTPKTVSNGEIGATWHIPTIMEIRSILPGDGPTSYNFFNATHPANSIYTENPSTFGYNNDTKYGVGNTSNPSTPTGTQFKSYWSSYSAGSLLRYAIRFLGTEYCSVWKYQIVDCNTTSARLVISARLINPIGESETTALSNKMTEVMSGSYDWTASETNGCVVRTFYLTGFGGSSAQPSPGDNCPNQESEIWSATPASASSAYFMRYAQTNYDWLYLHMDGWTRGFPVRLFRDN